MRLRVTKLIYPLVLLFAILSNAGMAQDQGDDLLLLIPSIISGANTAGSPTDTIDEGLQKVRELNGSWLFERESSFSDFIFEEYYRFNGATAVQLSDSVFAIGGNGSLLNDFSSEWCVGGIAGSYSTETESYIILCNWGFPDTDLGSLYAFDAVSNNFSFDHFFYIPSTGDLSTGTSTSGNATRLSPSFSSVLNRSSPLSQKSDSTLIERQEKLMIEEFNAQLSQVNSRRSLSLDKPQTPSKLQSHLTELLENKK